MLTSLIVFFLNPMVFNRGNRRHHIQIGRISLPHHRSRHFCTDLRLTVVPLPVRRERLLGFVVVVSVFVSLCPSDWLVGDVGFGWGVTTGPGCGLIVGLGSCSS